MKFTGDKINLVVYATKTKIRLAKLILQQRIKNISVHMERIEKLKEFLESSPSDSFLQHALALEYSKRGDEKSARTLFEEILTREPGYIGSYYHLAKLLERINETDAAIGWYEKGMEAAKKAGDNHALSELRSAYEEMMF